MDISENNRNALLGIKRKIDSKKSLKHDNYGVLDALKSDAKRYEPVCGKPPIEDDFSTIEAYNTAKTVYDECVVKERAIYQQQMNTASQQAGSTTNTLQTLYKSLTGQTNTQVQIDANGNPVAVPIQPTDKILGLPKVAFYTIVGLVVVLGVYLAFFRNK